LDENQLYTNVRFIFAFWVNLLFKKPGVKKIYEHSAFRYVANVLLEFLVKGKSGRLSASLRAHLQIKINCTLSAMRKGAFFRLTKALFLSTWKVKNGDHLPELPQCMWYMMEVGQ